MRNSLLYFLGGIIALAFVSGCQKDVDIFFPDPPDIIDIPLPPALKGNIQNFFDAVAADESEVTSQHSCFCWENDKIFALPSGTLILVNGSDFDFPADCNDTPGIFTIKEIDSKGEVLLYGRQTISNGELIESRAEYKIDATFNGNPISLREGRNIRILINDEQPEVRMELFYGSDQSDIPFDWAEADEDPNQWNNVQVSEWFLQDSAMTFSGFGYECFPDSLVWINVDKFFNVSEDSLTSACVMLPDSFGNVNTAVFMVFNDYNSLLGMSGDSATMKFCEPYDATPLGYNVTFVTISELGEDCYYLGSATADITENHIEMIEPVKTPFEDIKEFILNL